jgi:hypothetical protein
MNGAGLMKGWAPVSHFPRDLLASSRNMCQIVRMGRLKGRIGEDLVDERD